MTELKPCPFCGGNASLEDGRYSADGMTDEPWAVGCNACGVGIFRMPEYREENYWWLHTTEGEAHMRETVTEAWNTRYEPTCGEPRGFIECDEDNFGNPSFAELWCEYCDIELDPEWKHCPSCGRRVIEE